MTERDPESNSEKDGDASASGSGWRDQTQFERGEPYGAEPDAAAGSGAPKAAWIGALAGVAALFIGLLLGAPLFLALLLAVVAFIVSALVLSNAGAEPERRVAEKTPLGVDRASVQAGLDAAEADLAAADAIAAGKLSGRGLSAPIREMTAAARRVLDVIAQDPGDYDRARKFLKVYLPSARATVEKYAAFEVIDAELENRFRALLTEMRDTARRQEEALKLDDRTDLEVEMEVLAERLKS